MSSDPSPDFLVERASSQLEQAAHSVEALKRALDNLDADELAKVNNGEVVFYLECSKAPFARLLELVLSYGQWSSALKSCLLRTFPVRNRETFVKSNHRYVLERVALCLVSLPIPFDRDQTRAITDWRVTIELSIHVLETMGTLTFGNVFDEPEEVEFEGLMAGVKRKQNRGKNKVKEAPKTPVALDPGVLEKLELPFPQTAQEAEDAAHGLLANLLFSLKRYFAMLEYDFVYTAIQESSIIPLTVDTTNNLGSAQGQVQENGEDAATNAPASFAMVRPMKAALYFDSAEGLGEWRILISTRADRDLRDWRRRDAEFFRIIIKKIKELSCGHFSANNQKRLNKPDVDFPIFEAKMTRDTRLVYQVDCVPEYDSNASRFERQVIKVFGIYTHAQIDKRFWDSMGFQLCKKGKQHRDRCKFRNKPFDAGDYVVAPASFPLNPVEVEEKDDIIVPELPREDLEEIHSLLVLGKFVMLSQGLLNSILADLDVAHVFNVTPYEKEIIEHPFSCYVLGRSGTGKTTTMLFKMLGIERAYRIQSEQSEDARKPRQIFVTQSRVLATRVEEYFSKLLESLAAAKKSRKELRTIAREKNSQNEETSFLFDADDDVTWKASLPDKYSLLEDKHFPLFLTYEKLAQLLQGDIVDKYDEAPKTPAGKGRLITYEIFIQDYWPHFPQNLTRNLDPSLVYSELIGVIEGSEAALSQTTRYLNQSAYEGLSHRTQHVFAKNRGVVYALFLAFLKQKQQNSDQDVADRTHKILRAFETDGVPGTKIDYLYVDEAQDNLLIEAMLLRSICRNPDGLFWAGDTAQTIAIGSSFRFDDLKAFLYRLEKRRESKLVDGQKGAQGELKTFQLTVNYRSHGGIVRCAHSVIELITHFWPYTIDSMAPEQGIVDGLKPLFLSGWDTNTVQYEQFLFGDLGDRIEFGARQCILVRDENARTELRKQVGDIGLILTLYESKGLEFDDVLLYKFFEDSLADLGQWRVVLNLLGSDAGRLSVPAPRFDETRHAGICSELKFLYVAITRARRNLWIVDCSEKAEPMKTLWTAKDNIQICKPGSDVPRLAVSSSPEEWEKTARTLFANRRYLQAVHALQRAGLEREGRIAHTHYVREEARAINATNKELMIAKQTAFVLAAESFLECATTSRGNERRVFYHNAADCFERAAQIFNTPLEAARAAAAYEIAEEYNDAVRLYRKHDKFDEAVNIVTAHRDKVKPDLAQNVVDVARVFYFKQKELKKAQQLFDSVEEELEYLEENVLFDECYAAVLIEVGRYRDAADVHLAEGRTLEAVQTLLLDEGSEDSAKRANACILQGLWQKVSFNMEIRKESDGALKMLDLVAKMNANFLTPSEQDEVSMFQAIRSMNLKALREAAQRFYRRNERLQALMCLDYCFATPPKFAGQENTAICPVLEAFLVYCDLLRDTALTCNFDSPMVQRLFGFQPAPFKGMFQLHRSTWFHLHLASLPGLVLRTTEEPPELPGQVVQDTLKLLLWKRLADRIRAEDEECQRTKTFTPCLPFVMNKKCNLIECPRQHIPYEKLTQDWFTAQLRMCLQQVQVVHYLHAIPNEPMQKRTRQLRFWIRKFFDTLFPPTHFLGSPATARLDRIREAPRSLAIMKAWCSGILYGPPRNPTDPRILSTIYETVVLSLTIDKYEASKYISQGPYLRTYVSSAPYYRQTATGDAYVVPELLLSLKGSEKPFITAGILFLRQVLERQLPIDINVLRHFVEFLTGAAILANVKFNLHNVTLPRSWFLSLLHQITQREDIETSLLDVLLNCIAQIIEALVSGGIKASNLLFENRNLSDLRVIRDLYVAPFCRAIALIGFNIYNVRLRWDILNKLSPVRAAKPHWTFDRYARAQGWRGVEAGLFYSTESGLDDLVQLCHKSGKPPRGVPPVNVTRVPFESLEEVQHILVPHASSLAISSSLRDQAPASRGILTPHMPSLAIARSLRAEAPAFVPRSMKQQDAHQEVVRNRGNTLTNEKEGEGVAAEQVVDRPDADTADIMNAGKLVNAMANTVVEAPHPVIPENQLNLAQKLLKRYRYRVNHGNLEKKKTVVDSQLNVVYETCLKLSADMKWPNGNYYRKLYLGLVPHLLICINAVQRHAQNARGNAKKRLLKEEKQDLDDLTKEMNELSATFKLCKDLHKRLEPHSTLHKDRNLSELKSLVGKVEDLWSRVATGVGEVRFHLELAIKGIVKEAPPPKPAPKPELNMDDEVMLTKAELQAKAYEHCEHDY
ncbi:hypothetical protein BKA70DRAFT_1576722 [Coprinopsis sp. MPI-PUGE-AT-0042]|nr:hypothetical protein BKA70DRAFT_1576722 [Coprinopsis sp. MPI-PUGE-AT-0042]